MKVKAHGEVIGEMDPKKKIYAKMVSKRKHLMRKFNAWGIDGSFFTDTLLPGNYTIRIFEGDEGHMYETTAEVMDRLGMWYHFKLGEKDYGPQIFLPLEYWS